MSKKSESKTNIPRKLTNKEVQAMLIDNFVNLQRVLTNLTFKFESLSDNINKLLQLYELSAKGFLKRVEEGNMTGDDADILKKLDTLLDQNKTVAKGLTLIEEKMRHKLYGEHVPDSQERTNNNSEMRAPFGEKPRPLPRI